MGGKAASVRAAVIDHYFITKVSVVSIASISKAVIELLN
jgi:hypothetical protein